MRTSSEPVFEEDYIDCEMFAKTGIPIVKIVNNIKDNKKRIQ